MRRKDFSLRQAPSARTATSIAGRAPFAVFAPDKKHRKTQNQGMSHLHRCLCGNVFECRIDILPAWPSRILCREWLESLCDHCLGQILQHTTEEGLQSFVEVMSEYDPRSAMKARDRRRMLLA